MTTVTVVGLGKIGLPLALQFAGSGATVLGADTNPDVVEQVNAGQEVYVVGRILDDDTVKGGTGWGAEFAKLCNKPLFVFDQSKDGWFRWNGHAWEDGGEPVVTHPHFAGTGTRFIEANGLTAIEGLFDRSFG